MKEKSAAKKADDEVQAMLLTMERELKTFKAEPFIVKYKGFQRSIIRILVDRKIGKPRLYRFVQLERPNAFVGVQAFLEKSNSGIIYKFRFAYGTMELNQKEQNNEMLQFVYQRSLSDQRIKRFDRLGEWLGEEF